VQMVNVRFPERVGYGSIEMVDAADVSVRYGSVINSKIYTESNESDFLKVFFTALASMRTTTIIDGC